jgi:hypothetical protein
MQSVDFFMKGIQLLRNQNIVCMNYPRNPSEAQDDQKPLPVLYLIRVTKKKYASRTNSDQDGETRKVDQKSYCNAKRGNYGQAKKVKHFKL